MKCSYGFKHFFFLILLFTQFANAKSPCYKLATTVFFNSSLVPTISTPDSLKDANLGNVLQTPCTGRQNEENDKRNT